MNPEGESRPQWSATPRLADKSAPLFSEGDRGAVTAFEFICVQLCSSVARSSALASDLCFEQNPLQGKEESCT